MNLLKTRRLLESGKTIFDLPLRVAFYARVSTDRDEQLNSLSNQVSYYEDFITSRNNWVLAGAYIDEGISGTSTRKRDQFLRMIKDAHKDMFDLIITKEISRFSRSTLDSIQYTQELLDCGVGVYFQNDNINTLYTDAELRLTIMSSIAQDEVRRLSERVKFGIKQAYESGKVLGQSNIYGYDKKDGRLTINEKEAEFVRTLYALYAEDKYGFRTIARKLSEMGFTNQSGGEINPGTLRSILENPKYKGYYYGRKTESSDYRNKKAVKLPEEERLFYRDENIPPIVSEELWDKVNQILRCRREKYKQKSSGTQRRYPYSGKIKCEEHGTFFYRKVHKERRHSREVWACKVRLAKGASTCPMPEISTVELDAIMEYMGKEFLSSKHKVSESLISRYKETLSKSHSYDNELNKLGKELDRIQLKKDNLLDFSIDGTIGRDDFKRSNDRLNSQLEDIRTQMEQLEKERAKADDLANYMEQLNSCITKALDEETTPLDLARGLLQEVTVGKGSTKEHIRLNLLFSHGVAKGACIHNANILYRKTEVSPIVGSEKQSEELLKYLLSEFETDPQQIWTTNIFGKSLHELVKEGLSNKLTRMPEEAQNKMQMTLQRIINEGRSNLICLLF